jgi:Rieske 2Fe-2S family protein
MDFARPRTTGEPGQMRAFEEQTRKWEAKARALGHPVGNVGGTDQVSYMGLRMPIGAGRLSQTEGGKPAAPLMGRFKENDGGMTAARIHPCNYWQCSSDHAVTFRFTPLGPQKTLQEQCWLVHPDAVAGRDYTVDELTWLWKATTDEDVRIIEHNQRGVNSSAYAPGPYSTVENGVDTFVNWYLAQL